MFRNGKSWEEGEFSGCLGVGKDLSRYAREIWGKHDALALKLNWEDGLTPYK